jgi:YHS domain-containing protein
MCIVSGEKFGGDMGDPYVFTYQGREIKLCCKSCLKDFNKEPAKFLKKLEEAEKAAKEGKKAGGSTPQGQPAHEGHGGHQH